MSRFVIKSTKTGFDFKLIAANGESIGSSQVYQSEESCEKGIESVRRNALAADLEDQTVSNYDVKKHPKFEVYHDKGSGYRFRLTAKNGENILASQGYKEKASCFKGIESVRRNAPDAKVEHLEF